MKYPQVFSFVFFDLLYQVIHLIIFFRTWEKGSVYNDGTPEVHASSIGLAKAALESINGCNLFGEHGASW